MRVAADEVVTLSGSAGTSSSTAPTCPPTSTTREVLGASGHTDSNAEGGGSARGSDPDVRPRPRVSPTTTTHALPICGRCSVSLGKWLAGIFSALAIGSVCDCAFAFVGLLLGWGKGELASGQLQTVWSVMAATIGIMTACACNLLDADYPDTPLHKSGVSESPPTSAPATAEGHATAAERDSPTAERDSPTAERDSTAAEMDTAKAPHKAIQLARWTIILVAAVLLLGLAVWFRLRRYVDAWTGDFRCQDDRPSATCFAVAAPIVLVTAAAVQRWWFLRQISLGSENDSETASETSDVGNSTCQECSNGDLQDEEGGDGKSLKPSAPAVTHVSFVLEQLESDSPFEVRVRSIVHDARPRACQDCDNSGPDGVPDASLASEDDGGELEDGESRPIGEAHEAAARRWCSQWSPAKQCMFRTALALEQRLSSPGRLIVNQVCARAWVCMCVINALLANISSCFCHHRHSLPPAQQPTDRQIERAAQLHGESRAAHIVFGCCKSWQKQNSYGRTGY